MSGEEFSFMVRIPDEYRDQFIGHNTVRPNGFEAVFKVPERFAYAKRSGEIITDMLSKVGIQLKIELTEWGQWIDRVFKNADFDLSVIGHAEPFDINIYANPKYYFRYDNPNFQELIKKAEAERGLRRSGHTSQWFPDISRARSSLPFHNTREDIRIEKIFQEALPPAPPAQQPPGSKISPYIPSSKVNSLHFLLSLQ
jgi:hypothetical protein